MGLAPGAAANRKLTTAKLWLKPSGDSGYFDCGNILSYKTDSERKTAVFENVLAGFREAVEEKMIEQGAKIALTLNEHFVDLFKLFTGGAANANYSQDTVTAPTGTASLTIRAGHSYWLGAYYIDTVAIVEGATPRVEGMDYTVDYAAGVIHVGADETDGVTWTVTYGNSNAELNEHEINQVPSVTCDFILAEHDQESDALFAQTTGTARVWIASSAENDGGKYSEFELAMRLTAKPTVLARL